MTTAVSRHSLSHGVFPSYNHFPICGQFCICYQFCEDCFSKESPANKYHSWNDHWKSEDVMLALLLCTIQPELLKVCSWNCGILVFANICWISRSISPSAQYVEDIFLSLKCSIWILSLAVTMERNWKQEPQFAQCTISLLNFRLFPTACVDRVECEEQMLPLYLSLLMASVTPRDGRINFTNVTPLFSAAIKPSADQTFDAVVMGTGTWWT